MEECLAWVTWEVLLQIKVFLSECTSHVGFLRQPNGIGLCALTEQDFDLGEYFPYDLGVWQDLESGARSMTNLTYCTSRLISLKLIIRDIFPIV